MSADMSRVIQRLVTSTPNPLPSSWFVYFSLNTESNHLQLLSSAGKQSNNLRLGSCIHTSLIKNPPSFHNHTSAHLIIYNSLLHIYCKSGKLNDAVKLFDEMPLRDSVSWNSLISGFLKIGELQLGFGYFKLLLSSSIYRFDQASLTTVLSACGGLMESLEMVKMIHTLVILNGYEKEIAVGNALTTSYFRCRAFGSGMQVFDEMVEIRNVVTWTAVITGLAQNELYVESLNLFVKMYCGGSVKPNCLTYLNALSACSGLLALNQGAQIHSIVLKLGFQSDLCIETALMDMYSKCGYVDNAWRVFESAEVIDEVSITVILVGLAQNGFEEEALQMFVKMVKAGTSIDPNMISAILGVFDINTLGVQIHSLVIKKGFDSNIFVCNGLINTYSKHGELEESVKVFDQMPNKNQVSWNSMIAAFARHGDGLKALQFYEKMNFEPTDVTFLSLLHACSHVGLLHKGMELLQVMDKEYGMQPRMEHYACIVDMLGRAGLLEEAKEFIEGLPVKPGVLVWQALLGACSIYNDVNMGKYAADQLAEVAPESPVPFVSMANIYSSIGQWKKRASTMKKMKEKGVVKETGASWIEIEKKIHSFVVADRMHPRGGDVYVILLMLFGHMRDEGFVPDNVFIT
ncbi:hypothetical protein CASFOL_026555 [Castilleja foliolosa]|uniref:Pentatricopeptide repeat-containing protein n=1 Tax=Castilleja foliolosa TaxID=1961234 RepID=A0ABD3CHE0_9LAMI